MEETGPAGGDSRTGQQAFVEALFRDQYPTLVRFAWLLVGDPGLAEEIVQEGFAKLYETWPKLRKPSSAAAYLRKIIINLARSRWRRAKLSAREAGLSLASSPTATGMSDTETKMGILLAMRRLPRRQRECVSLRYFLDLSEVETAEMLRISTGSVKTHLHRALATLNRELGERNER